jgi:Phosphoglycerate kinase
VVADTQGRPKDGPEDKFRLTPVVPRLSELLGVDVQKVDDCIGPEVEEAVKKMENGQVGTVPGLQWTASLCCLAARPLLVAVRAVHGPALAVLPRFRSQSAASDDRKVQAHQAGTSAWGVSRKQLPRPATTSFVSRLRRCWCWRTYGSTRRRRRTT